MGRIRFGHRDNLSTPRQVVEQPVVTVSDFPEYHEKCREVANLEHSLIDLKDYWEAFKPETIVEEKIVEVVVNKEVPVEVIKEVVREVKVIEEKRVEVPVEHTVYLDKIVPVEVVREIEKFIDKEIAFVPKFIWFIIALETLFIMYLLILNH